MQVGKWTWLEVAKIALGVLTPITIFYLSFIVENSIRQREVVRQRDEAVRAFAQDVYFRRVRAELLGFGLRRHAKEPTAVSLSEIVERKSEYDEAYAEWNEKSQANLLMLRRLLNSDVYTNLEAIVDHHLVGLGFLPLDRCLTEAYDEAIRSRDPVPLLNDCNTKDLLEFILLCGSAISDELFHASYENTELESSVVLLHGNIAHACQVPQVGGRFRGYAPPG